MCLLVYYIGYEVNGRNHVKKGRNLEKKQERLKSKGQRSGPAVLLRIKVERFAYFVNRLYDV